MGQADKPSENDQKRKTFTENGATTGPETSWLRHVLNFDTVCKLKSPAARTVSERSIHRDDFMRNARSAERESLGKFFSM